MVLLACYFRLRRQAITPNTDSPDMILTALRNEPIEKKLPHDPIDPIEKTDPTEPIDMNEFLQPIHKNELVEAILHLDDDDVAMMHSCISHRYAPYGTHTFFHWLAWRKNSPYGRVSQRSSLPSSTHVRLRLVALA